MNKEAGENQLQTHSISTGMNKSTAIETDGSRLGEEHGERVSSSRSEEDNRHAEGSD